ncbi:MAG: hypothetical protein HPY59_00630 [Anaerolineae bacterium]|nr:hypothetical protein [Anaerolineae bacterium]
MPRLSVWFIRAALAYLLVGFTWGALMLANIGLRFFPQAWWLLPSHVEFLLAGWLVQLAFGTAFWILPRFMRRPFHGNEKLGWAAFFCLNLGILTTAASDLTNGTALLAAGRTAEVLGAALFAWSVWQRVKPYGG